MHWHSWRILWVKEFKAFLWQHWPVHKERGTLSNKPSPNNHVTHFLMMEYWKCIKSWAFPFATPHLEERSHQKNGFFLANLTDTIQRLERNNLSVLSAKCCVAPIYYLRSIFILPNSKKFVLLKWKMGLWCSLESHFISFQLFSDILLNLYIHLFII